MDCIPFLAIVEFKPITFGAIEIDRGDLYYGFYLELPAKSTGFNAF